MTSKYRVTIENLEDNHVQVIELDNVQFAWTRDIPYLFSANSMEPVGVSVHYSHFTMSGSQVIAAELFKETEDCE